MSRFHFFCLFLLAGSLVWAFSGQEKQSSWDHVGSYGLYLAAGLVGVAALPLTLMAAGFGVGGIAAGSIGAAAMSLAAKSGFGMWLVSAAQSAGVLGVGMVTKAIVGAASFLTAWFFGGYN